MDILNNVAAVIRTWSNNEKIAESVRRALMAGIGQVIVVVKDEDPKLYGAVERRLADEIALYPSRLHIITMRIGYGWSKALNAALEDVRQLNELAMADGKPQIEYVLNVSNEALYTREHLNFMVQAIRARDAAAVGTTFRGLQDGIEVELGVTYRQPRNTMMLIRFATYLCIGGFDVMCDEYGGMEDLEWLTRLQVFGSGHFMLDLKVDLILGRNHNQFEKEKRELQASIAIIKRYEALSAAGAALLAIDLS